VIVESLTKSLRLMLIVFLLRAVVQAVLAAQAAKRYCTCVLSLGK